jgi:hypothetical protein
MSECCCASWIPFHEKYEEATETEEHRIEQRQATMKRVHGMVCTKQSNQLLLAVRLAGRDSITDSKLPSVESDSILVVVMRCAQDLNRMSCREFSICCDEPERLRLQGDG